MSVALVGARSVRPPVVSAGARGPTLALAQAEPSWRASAACEGSNASAFFPPSSTEPREQRQRREGEAREMCDRCVVRDSCLEYALFVEEPYGIWGGLNEIERRRLLRRRTTA